MSTSINKQDLEPGYIVWLREDAHLIDNEAFTRSGLHERVLNHPALIVNTLSNQHDYVWICYCSGSAKMANLPIAYDTDGELEPCSECRYPHGFASHRFEQHNVWLGLPKNFMTATIVHHNNNVLYHRNPDAKLGKPTHVILKRIYEVPTSFLAPLGERFRSRVLRSHRLDYMSMHLVMARITPTLRNLARYSYALRVLERQDGNPKVDVTNEEGEESGGMRQGKAAPVDIRKTKEVVKGLFLDLQSSRLWGSPFGLMADWWARQGL